RLQRSGGRVDRALVEADLVERLRQRLLRLNAAVDDRRIGERCERRAEQRGDSGGFHGSGVGKAGRGVEANRIVACPARSDRYRTHARGGFFAGRTLSPWRFGRAGGTASCSKAAAFGCSSAATARAVCADES